MSITLRGARIWDGEAEGPTRRPHQIIIDRGRITSIHPHGLDGVGASKPEVSNPEGFFDLSGLFVMPGLIDGHIHLCLDPTLKSPDEQAKVLAADLDAGMRDRARAMVEAGITTARDLGGGDWRALEVRDEIADGALPGPRLLCAGQPLTRPKGHCHFWGGGAVTPEEQRAVIDRQIEHGVDWIKAMATGGVFTKGSDAKSAQFSQDEMADMVSHAARAGRRVAAHCHGTVGIDNAVRGGVHTIEHCSFAGQGGFGTDIDEGVVATLSHSGTWVSPTVNLGWGRRITDEHGQPTPFFKRMSAMLHRLRSAGVPLLASTDAGIPGVAHHRFAEGLLAFQRFAGFSAVELLRTATSDAARALELEHETGRIRAGLSADLIAVRRDPTIDPTTLLDPVLVMARGRIVTRPEAA